MYNHRNKQTNDKYNKQIQDISVKEKTFKINFGTT